ncbi:MAG TPA: hypothetical protein VJ044_14630 [Candidatus Hodarchaeales archaeon]|nr:hypothetical protein [Candidatus Hodarchaeales archaeon]
MFVEIPPDQRIEVLKVFKQIVGEAPINSIALFHRSGATLLFFSEYASDSVLLLSAASESMFATGGMVCQRMDLGELREILIRGEKGYTILLFSDLILAGAGSDVSTLAIALRAFRMNFARIHAIFHPEFAKKHNLMF